MNLAAAGAGLDPDRISFTATLHAARRTICTARAGIGTALAGTETEILSCLVPQRDGRVCLRAVNKRVSPYPSRRNLTGPISQHAECTVLITTPGTTTRTTTDQPRHPGNRENQPP